ncbi:hypothetical protein GS452_27165 [Rhodococcus hoagii]|nr:hypothetical protein [Prescottella equi]
MLGGDGLAGGLVAVGIDEAVQRSGSGAVGRVFGVDGDSLGGVGASGFECGGVLGAAVAQRLAT